MFAAIAAGGCAQCIDVVVNYQSMIGTVNAD
jgi:hypothetical protein